MTFLKRIALFFMLNILIVLTVTTLVQWLGLEVYMTQRGLNFEHLAIFCMIWGMSSAFISLALSKQMAKWMMGVQILDPVRSTGMEKQIVDAVYRLAKKAGMSHMPEVGIFHSKSPNAFATGPSAKRSLVAVSDSLINNLSEDEVHAVIGHEIAHITNGDMITMTLIQGVINGFVMFLARVCAWMAASALSGRSRNSRSNASPMMYYLFTMLFQTVFMLLGMLLVAAYSRWREYRADAGGANLTSRAAMAGALKSLERATAPQAQNEQSEANQRSAAFDTLQINGSRRSWLQLLATHPPIEERIARLEKRAIGAY